MSDQLFDACAPVAREMARTGVVPDDLKARIQAIYGPVDDVRVHWGATRDRGGNPVGKWRAVSESDFVTGRPDDIDIYLARERAE
jgi:hypothetical protein